MNLKLFFISFLCFLFFASKNSLAWRDNVDSARDDIKLIDEDVSKRTLTSKTYKNEDGTYTSKFWELPIHYEDEFGQLQEIDNDLVTSNDPDFDYVNTKNKTKTWFKSKIYEDTPNIKLQQGNAFIEVYSLKNVEFKKTNSESQEYISFIKKLKDLKPNNYWNGNIKSGEPQLDERGKLNKFKYHDVFENQKSETDITYSVWDHKLQEEIMMREFIGFPEISQRIKLTNAFAVLINDEIQIFNDRTYELLWTLPRPFMYELNNKESVNLGVYYDVACENNISISRCDDLIVTKRFTKEGRNWLSDENRQYPVIIDPDYTADSGDTYLAGSDDSYATARSTCVDYSPSLYLIAAGQRFQNGSIYGEYNLNRSVIKFDTSSIGAGSIVNQVNLNMTVVAVSTDYNVYTDIEIVKYDWSDYDPVTEANRDTVYDGILTATEDDSIWQNTEDVSVGTEYSSGNLDTSWINKTGDTYYGLRSSREADNQAPSNASDRAERVYLYSQDETTSSKRPTLTVTYTANNAPTNDSLTFTNPYGGSGNTVINNGTTEWTFQAEITDTDGYEDIDTVVLRLANSSDNTTPFDSLKYTWAQATDTFSETADTQGAASIASDSTDSDCSGNTCTLDFKIVFNSNFAIVNTEYDAEILTTDDNSTTDEDSYADFYAVFINPPPWVIENLDASLDIFEEGTEEDLETVHQEDIVSAKLVNASYQIATFKLGFDQSLDWTSLSAGANATQAFMHYPGGFNSLPGASGGAYTLFVPKGNSYSVRICPNASSLEEITSNCSGVYYLDENSSNVIVANIDSIDYWQVAGLTGTGGESVDPFFSFAVEEVGLNTVTNAITTSVATTSDMIPFSTLIVGTPEYAAHKLTASTNASNGYSIKVKLVNFLQGNYPGNIISEFSANGAEWSNPKTWASPDGVIPNTNTGWIGANTSDTRVPNWVTGAGKFGPLNSTYNTVMYSDTSDGDGTSCYVTYGIEVNEYQPTDLYAGTLVYNVLPNY